MSIESNSADEAAFRHTCVHEAGHDVVADSFKLQPQAFVGGLHEGTVVRALVGTPLQAAAVGWAGLVAELLLLGDAGPDRRLPKIEFTRGNLFIWHEDFFCNSWFRGDVLSPSDRRPIAALSKSDSLEALRLAFDIVDSRRDIVEFMARRLMEDHRRFVFETRNDPGRGERAVQSFAVRALYK